MATISRVVPRRRTTYSALAVLVALVLGLAVGAVGGTTWSSHDDELGGWMTGTAHVGEQQLSVDVGGWTYGVSGAVPLWYDGAGSTHEGGWPDCLQVPAGTNVQLRFQARKVEVDGLGLRPIVAVDCR